MRVGISSMQRVANYGSFLQSYGLSKEIKTAGHDVEFIDYRPGKMVAPKTEVLEAQAKELAKDAMKWASSVALIRKSLPKAHQARIQLERAFANQFLPTLGIMPTTKYEAEIDVLVVGSDEVFNCLQRNPKTGFATDLLGGAPYPQISYAASFGNTTLDQLKMHNLDTRVAELLRNFQVISVRDMNSRRIVAELTGTEPEVHIDPVLLHGFDHKVFDQKRLVQDRYAIVYAYPNRLRTDEINAIKNLASEQNIKLIAVGGYYEFCDDNILCTPFEIPALFRHAEFVVTDTFHGTIFSMLAHTPFATFVRGGHGSTYGNSEKMSYLLELFDLQDRAVENIAQLDQVLAPSLDLENLERKLEFQRDVARKYLTRSIQIPNQTV